MEASMAISWSSVILVVARTQIAGIICIQGTLTVARANGKAGIIRPMPSEIATLISNRCGSLIHTHAGRVSNRCTSRADGLTDRMRSKAGLVESRTSQAGAGMIDHFDTPCEPERARVLATVLCPKKLALLLVRMISTTVDLLRHTGVHTLIAKLDRRR